MKKVTFVLFIMIAVLGHSKGVQKLIYQNDILGLKKYIEKKETLDETITIDDGEKLHIMEYAAYLNRLNCLKLIINSKSKIQNFEELVSRSFVYAITEKGREVMLNYLFNLNPDLSVTVKELDNRNAIMWAIINYNSSWYFKLKNKSDLTYVDSYGNNLFHFLAKYGYEVEIFKALLTNKKIDINKVNVFHEKPLNLIFSTANILLKEEFIQQKSSFYDDKSAYRDAVISGDDYFYDYVVDLIDTLYNWTLINSYYIDEIVSNYSLEIAITNNCVYLAKIILKQMIFDINNASSENKKRMLGVLVSIFEGRYFEDGSKFHTTNVALWTKNIKMFEFVVESMSQINEIQTECIHFNNKKKEEIIEIPNLSYPKSDYKIAINFYGKTYVDSLNTANSISF